MRFIDSHAKIGTSKLQWERNVLKPIKESWIERVTAIHNFHVEQLRSHNNNWRIQDTAANLKRSIGCVSESLMLYDWVKSHPKIEKFKTAREAVQFVREKKKEFRIL